MIDSTNLGNEESVRDGHLNLLTSAGEDPVFVQRCAENRFGGRGRQRPGLLPRPTDRSRLL